MYLCIPRINNAKIEEGVFVVPQIMELMQDIKSEDRLSEVEKQHENYPKSQYQYFWEIKLLKETGIAWRERRLISNLYMAQSVKVRLNRGETGSVKIGRGVRQACCLSPIMFNLYSEYRTKEALEGLGDYKIGGQIIHTVKHADDLVLLAKEGATGHD